MQVSVETLKDIARKITVTIDAEVFDSSINSKIAAYAKNAKVPGFRKGKMPKHFLEKQFGGAALKDAVDSLINEYYPKALQEEKIVPASLLLINPTQVERGKPFIFEAEIEVFPEFDVPTLQGETIEKMVIKVEKADIDRTIESIQKRQIEYTASGKAAKDGDQIIMDFSGTIDGDAFEGGEAKDATLVLGEGRFMKEFEKNLSGTKVGDEKTFKVAFPKDYHGADVAGKTAEFSVTVKQVNSGKLPKIDEAFAKSLGIEGGVKTMKEEISTGLEREAEQKIRSHTREQVFAALSKNNDFPLPKALVEEEINRAVAEVTSQLEKQGMPSTSIDRNNYEAPAKDRVKLGLLVRSVVEAEKLDVDKTLLEARVREMASNYSDPEEYMKYMLNDEAQRNQIAGAVIEEQVVAHLLSTATIKEVKKSYKAFMQG